jgi:hypothetical protein
MAARGDGDAAPDQDDSAAIKKIIPLFYRPIGYVSAVFIANICSMQSRITAFMLLYSNSGYVYSSD